MTLRSMEIYLAVIECGTMRGAAEKLFISQPSVSGAVAEIEREYGVLLFERLGKRLYLTREGEKLAGYARRLLSLRSEMERQMGGAGDALPLRLGATVTVGAGVIGGVLRRLGGPESRVLVASTPEIEQKLLRNELDAALVEGGIQSPDLLVTPAIPDELHLICRRDHLLAEKAAVELADLRSESLILRERGSRTREALEKRFEEEHETMRIAWECASTQAMLSAVEGGFGVAILSPRLIDHYPGLRAVPLAFHMKHTFCTVVHKDKFLSPRLLAFLKCCRENDK